MERRRGKGEGSISQRSDGRWMGRVNLGRGADGRRKRKYVYGDTEGDVIRQMKKQNGRAVDGLLLSTSTPTVAVHLEDWFSTYSDEWKPSTRRSYRGAIDLYLVPAFGPVRLEQLTPRAIQQWLTSHKKEHGARRRIEIAHAALRSALSEAQRLQLVTINAAALVNVPRSTARPVVPLDVEQAKTFLEVAGAHRLGALFSVALACGLRLGEATGLSWSDVDLDTGEVRVRQQLQAVKKQLVLQDLKTENSRRTLVFPDVCVQALREHRRRQLEERLKAGARWVDTGLVFTTYRTCKEGKGMSMKVGAGLHPRNVSRILSSLLKTANLPHIRFHDLRHSAASLLLASGVELVEVSKLLGHSEIRVTADLYGHLVKQTAAKAARIMDGLLAR
jgi:integrase